MTEIHTASSVFSEYVGNQTLQANESYRLLCFVVQLRVQEGLLIYNTLSRCMYLLDEQEQKKIFEIKLLKEKWFLVPQDFNDKEFCNQVRSIAQMLQKPHKGLSKYTVFTTLDCNARCFYCYEMGRERVSMTEDTALQVAQFIQETCNKDKIHILWFGGEPLYNMKVIDIICKELVSARIEFDSKMISNAYLFTQEIVNKSIEDWHLKEIQITLDGTEKVYNRVKRYIYPNTNAFQHVLDNIKLLLEAKIKVVIRLNIDLYNADNLVELVKELSYSIGCPKNLTIYTRTLFETGNSITHTPEQRKILFEKTSLLKNTIRESGFRRNKKIPDFIRKNRCMADNPSAITISPTGNLGVCQHYTDTNTIGHLSEKRIDTQKSKQLRAYCKDLPECKNCFFRPDCFRPEICVETFCTPEKRGDYLQDIHQQMLNTFHEYTKRKSNS